MKLLVVLLSLFLVGCWGSEFSAPPFQESLEASTTGESGTVGASTTAGVLGSTGSSASSSDGSGGATGSSSTTGDGGVDSVGPTTTDSSSSATTGGGTTTSAGGNETATVATTGDSCREPDVAGPMRSFTWESYAASYSRLCGDSQSSGNLYCGSLDGEPCMELKFQITAMEWEPLLWRLTFEEIEEPQPLTMTQQCASLEQPCNYQVAVPWTFVYMLQLVETDTGYAVKAFYLLGDDPAQHGVRHAINGEFAPDTQEYCGSGNPNDFVGDLWKEYVAYVRSLTWEC